MRSSIAQRERSKTRFVVHFFSELEAKIFIDRSLEHFWNLFLVYAPVFGGFRVLILNTNSGGVVRFD